MGIELISFTRIKEALSYFQTRHLLLFSVEIRQKYSFKRRNGDYFARVILIRSFHPCECSQRPPVSVCLSVRISVSFLSLHFVIQTGKSILWLRYVCLSVWDSYNIWITSLLTRFMLNSSYFIFCISKYSFKNFVLKISFCFTLLWSFFLICSRKTSNAWHSKLHIYYKCAFFSQNIIPFHGTYTHLISFTPTNKKFQPTLLQFLWNLKMLSVNVQIS
jgi:hypothetical protein